MTCIQYINNVRLEKAVELFEHGETSILEVSLSVGFHNLSYFYRAFKAKYHMTPLAFIKRVELDSVKAHQCHLQVSDSTKESLNCIRNGRKNIHRSNQMQIKDTMSYYFLIFYEKCH